MLILYVHNIIAYIMICNSVILSNNGFRQLRYRVNDIGGYPVFRPRLSMLPHRFLPLIILLKQFWPFFADFLLGLPWWLKKTTFRMGRSTAVIFSDVMRTPVNILRVQWELGILPNKQTCPKFRKGILSKIARCVLPCPACRFCKRMLD